MERTWRNYLKLFSVTFYLSAFTFGGGYVIVALMRKKIVEDLKWISENEMLNLTALAQSSPGAVAINSSILVGYRMLGVPGAFAAIFGTILPPLVIITVISYFYQAFRESAVVSMVLKGMAAAIGAIIVDVVFKMGREIIRQKLFYTTAIMFLAFLAKILFDRVMLILLVCGVIGFLVAWFANRTEKEVDSPL